MTGRPTTRLVVVALLVASATGACSNSNEQRPLALDAYPGFGRSESSAGRDDAIAAWESFRREVLVQPCMVRHGFSYWPEILYPGLDHVAAFLGISIPQTAAAPGIVKNREYIDGLSEGDSDRYAFAKWGETSRDEHTSIFPEDVGESPKQFPRGGCSGKADDAIPGVWETKRALSDELEEINHKLNRTHPIGRRDAKEYSINREVMEDDFVERHRDELEATRKQYSDVLNRIRADFAFVRSVQEHVVYSRSTG